MTTKSPFEVPTEMREFAEKSVDQARKAFDGFMTAAQKASSQIQGSTETAHNTALDATKKAMTYAEGNVSAAFELAQKLVRAKDISEVMSMQTEFLKTQMASLQSQMKDLGQTKDAAPAAKPAPKGK
jgi:phasin